MSNTDDGSRSTAKLRSRGVPSTLDRAGSGNNECATNRGLTGISGASDWMNDPTGASVLAVPPFVVRGLHRSTAGRGLAQPR
jgi:hypothetical protein